MSLGLPQSKGDWDARAGSLAVQLRNTLADVRRFQVLLVATPDATLIAAGFVQAEVNTLKSAYIDLDKLAAIYGAAATQSTTYDFQTFAKLLCGVI